MIEYFYRADRCFVYQFHRCQLSYSRVILTLSFMELDVSRAARIFQYSESGYENKEDSTKECTHTLILVRSIAGGSFMLAAQ